MPYLPIPSGRVLFLCPREHHTPPHTTTHHHTMQITKTTVVKFLCLAVAAYFIIGSLAALANTAELAVQTL